MMAVDIISPDARKKVDELFLYWLSEPSTQDLLRQEVAMVCGLQPDHRVSASQGVHSKVRPMSPTARAITPPPSLPSLSPSPSLSRSSPRSRLQVPQVTATSEVTSIKPVEVDETDSPALPIIIKTTGEVSCVQSKPMSPIFVIPCFYFPNGKQVEGKEEEMAKIMINVGKIFERYPRQDVPLKDFHLIIEALKLPSYWKIPLFQAISGRRRKYANLALFKKVWTEIIETCHDDASKFVYLMTSSDPDRNHLIPSDFNQLIQDIVEYHPGLEFLRDAPEFHARYIETVIGRIFYKVDKTWKNRITIQDLRNSNFLQSLEMLSYEDDINRFTDFFSYEHFYVIYCKFWELDSDHDLLIDEHDLIRHADHSQ
jgi:serine/threonine-protein phosphatase 2A regulatory subunit B''